MPSRLQRALRYLLLVVSSVWLAIDPCVFLRAADYVFSHLAGPSRGPGTADGIGALAQFTNPTGVTADSLGNLYVADLWNHSIRKITPNGTVSTIAGSPGAAGTADGTGAAARFNKPFGICIDGAGNLYVTDSGNHTVRKISPDYSVTTLAGSAGFSGYQNGTGGGARFNNPNAISVAGDGTLFVGDVDNHRIRAISPAGVVSTFAGSGTHGSDDGIGTAASFRGPNGIAINPVGALIVADGATLRRVDADGTVTTIAGLAGSTGFSVDGQGSAARFGSATGVAVDQAGIVYITDQLYPSIRKMTPDYVVTTLAGHEQGVVDGSGVNARFYGPTGIAVSTSGALYVTDQQGNAVRKVTLSGDVTTLAGTSSLLDRFDGQGAKARFNAPAGVAVDSHSIVYVADYWNNAIRKITPDGVVSTFAGSYASGPGANFSFNWPQYLAVDSGDNVYVTHQSRAILRIAPTGDVTVFAGDVARRGTTDGIGANARFSLASSLALDRQDNVYVVDGFTIRKITPAAVVSTILLNAPGASEPPRCDGIAVNPAGGFYATDSFNHVIWKITADGTSTVLAGAIGKYYPWTDGPAGVARFDSPVGIAVDRDGAIYVTELYHTIRKVTPDGNVSTLGGSHDGPGSVDATGTGSRFDTPKSIAVDSTGVLYVADYDNSAIRKGTPLVAITITAQPIDQTVVTGQSATFSVSAVGAGLSYQWRKDGVAITANASATSASLLLPHTTADDRGSYDCVISNATGSITTGAAQLTVAASARARLVNIATRAYCSTGDNVTIGGFVVTGNSSKKVLIRAIGPTLTSLGIAQSEVLMDPMLEVYRGAAVIARNDNWDGDANASEISRVGAAVGANPISANDHASSAIVTTLEPGVYTFLTKGSGGTSGIVLLEVYDADSAGASSNFVNISTRAKATTGSGVTIGGFVIAGDHAKQILIRAVGPTLISQGINSSEALSDPIVDLYQGTTVIATNDDWTASDNNAAITSTANRVGAAPLATSDVRSAALLSLLQPGVYTFVGRGKNNSSGVVLVEIYDAD